MRELNNNYQHEVIPIIISNKDDIYKLLTVFHHKNYIK